MSLFIRCINIIIQKKIDFKDLPEDFREIIIERSSYYEILSQCYDYINSYEYSNDIINKHKKTINEVNYKLLSTEIIIRFINDLLKIINYINELEINRINKIDFLVKNFNQLYDEIKNKSLNELEEIQIKFWSDYSDN